MSIFLINNDCFHNMTVVLILILILLLILILIRFTIRSFQRQVPDLHIHMIIFRYIMIQFRLSNREGCAIAPTSFICPSSMLLSSHWSGRVLFSQVTILSNVILINQMGRALILLLLLSDSGRRLYSSTYGLDPSFIFNYKRGKLCCGISYCCIIFVFQFYVLHCRMERDLLLLLIRR